MGVPLVGDGGTHSGEPERVDQRFVRRSGSALMSVKVVVPISDTFLVD